MFVSIALRLCVCMSVSFCSSFYRSSVRLCMWTLNTNFANTYSLSQIDGIIRPCANIDLVSFHLIRLVSHTQTHALPVIKINFFYGMTFRGFFFLGLSNVNRQSWNWLQMKDIDIICVNDILRFLPSPLPSYRILNGFNDIDSVKRFSILIKITWSYSSFRWGFCNLR